MRLIIGTLFFRLQRRMNWYWGKQKYARTRNQQLLPYEAVVHQTPLRRELQSVDMWLQDNKVINLRIAVAKLNRIIIRPGETFSYWRLIGKPTRSQGYVDGMILSQGKVTVGTGGGLCQLSNLIYWMTLHTPLSVTERHRHSYDVFPDSGRTQPFGSGATCYYNYVDLQITNDTDAVYQLDLAVTDHQLVGSWRVSEESRYQYQIYERKHWFTQEYWGGYVRHNEIGRRTMTLEGDILHDELLTENHALMMYEPYLPEASGNG
ncbi:vancomycin resistance protein [Paenibacillus albiflavus]|uniref:Vancomycin resistance protein n=1 Tax=Paenibacillus albiflavus TaxID=2545760 RepID=A0A4R4EA47_9BACL|nr:VanW family protein [Paenibacillus albiflavus]TCZ75913.1 vancomycin resistance protein [Paenibacillus albiflavus]